MYSFVLSVSVTPKQARRREHAGASEELNIARAEMRDSKRSRCVVCAELKKLQ